MDGIEPNLQINTGEWKENLAPLIKL